MRYAMTEAAIRALEESELEFVVGGIAPPGTCEGYDLCPEPPCE